MIYAMNLPSLRKRDWAIILVVVAAWVTALVLVGERQGVPTLVSFLALTFVVLMFFIAIENLRTTRDSLEITRQSLELTRIDVGARIRPFVSIARIVAHKPAPAPFEACWVVLQNTGSVPAQDLNVLISNINTDTRETVELVRQHIPVMAPNVEDTAIFSYVRSNIEPMVRAGTTNVEVFVTYKGLNQTHETKETFRMSLYDPRDVSMGSSQFGFMPVDPSHYT